MEALFFLFSISLLIDNVFEDTAARAEVCRSIVPETFYPRATVAPKHLVRQDGDTLVFVANRVQFTVALGAQRRYYRDGAVVGTLLLTEEPLIPLIPVMWYPVHTDPTTNKTRCIAEPLTAVETRLVELPQ